MNPPAIQPEASGIQPAFPVEPKSRYIDSEWNGLTKREYIATQLLSGLLAGRKVAGRRFKNLASIAIHHADELLAQVSESPV